MYNVNDILFLKKIFMHFTYFPYLFIFWLHRVLFAAHGIFVEA